MASSTDAPRPRPPSRKGKGPTPGSFKPGDPRINRRGVPRRALAAAEAVRELLDPEQWVAFELDVANDATRPLNERKDSWRALIDRGFVRPPTTTLTGEAEPDLEPDLSGLDLETLRAVVALDEQRGRIDAERERLIAAATADQRLPEPTVTDDNAAGDTTTGTHALATPRNPEAA